ncbi:MAG: hypothetical protein HUU35_17405, partial [Armatimonadetes bacterium]|nr:hypothetical protein [Armatimonadota bacterium]
MPRLLWITMLSSLWPLAAADLPLVDWSAPEVLQQISLNGGRDAAFALIDGPAGKALEITCTPGENSYPGVAIKPATGVWDLAAYGTVQAQVTNTGGAKLTVTLRLDNPGDWQQNPWNADHVTLEPGQSGRVTVYFGYSWGRRGYALDPTKINQLLLYTGKPAAELKLRVDSIVASGAPGSRPPGLVDPLRPAGGVLLDLAQPVT